MQKQPRLEFFDFIGAMRKNAMRDLKHQNLTYMELKEQEINFSELTDEILEKLDNSDREIIVRYISTLDIIQAQESEYLYYAGYTDCISLLKSMGVF
jgi:hypothetical protein